MTPVRLLVPALLLALALAVYSFAAGQNTVGALACFAVLCEVVAIAMAIRDRGR